MDFESEQVTLKLTTNQDILDSLRRNKAFKRTPGERKDYISMMFNSTEIRFYPGEPITVGRTVANSLRRSSVIVVGDDQISGEMLPFLEVASVHNLGRLVERTASDRAVCPYCDKSFASVAQLGGHMINGHKELDHDAPGRAMAEADDAAKRFERLKAATDAKESEASE